MQTLYLILALVGIIAVIVLLVKKYETRTVLLGAGFILCLLALQPMLALTEFTNAMTKAGLIKAICASMGFAWVMKFTGCDQHLVNALTKPLGNLGILLVPITVLLTSLINIAIPSAAGCSAAVGATLIPLLMAAGIRPAMAAAAVFAGTFGATLSPGSAHNVYVTDIVKATDPAYTVQQVIAVQIPNTVSAVIIMMVCLTVVAIVLKDYNKGTNYLLNSDGTTSGNVGGASNENKEDFKVNYLYAIMPVVPLVVLIIGGTSLGNLPGLTWTKMGVAEAMIHGAIVSLFVTVTNPQNITKEFFNGMGSAYANIIGIIIAATVFVAGLKACGAIDWIIEILKNEQEYVKFGGTFIPFLMGIITGSGDAATFAFNEAITIKAHELGFDQATLGMLAAISGALGRTASPIAGACIVCAGLAGANPFHIAKRTVLGSVIGVLFIAFFLL
ncbi:MAG: C4-dicarboxylate transporter DcuC [Campylobacter sp.]|nr:C4-dicarboxylate transporter DcuC [Campylobacter sp.]